MQPARQGRIATLEVVAATSNYDRSDNLRKVRKPGAMFNRQLAVWSDLPCLPGQRLLSYRTAR